MDERRLYTISEAMEYLGVSRTTIYRWAQAGHLELLKVRGTTRIRGSELDRLVNESEALYPTQETVEGRKA